MNSLSAIHNPHRTEDKNKKCYFAKNRRNQ